MAPLTSCSTLLELLIRHGGEMGEIKAQARVINILAGLMHVVAEHFAQSRLKQMRGAVVAHYRAAAHDVNLRRDLAAD
jgi:hypothetical protein